MAQNFLGRRPFEARRRRTEAEFETPVFGVFEPGVDVMITIFCGFSLFSAKKLAFFSITNVMIKILHNLALFGVKDANFYADIFGEKNLKS
jgi:hypothetical protein